MISISDEEVDLEEAQMLGEKRKLSDSSIESKAETNHKSKRHCYDARQSIELLHDFSSCRRPMSLSATEVNMCQYKIKRVLFFYCTIPPKNTV